MKVVYKEGSVLSCPAILSGKVYDVLDIDTHNGQLFYFIDDEDKDDTDPYPYEAYLFDIVED